MSRARAICWPYLRRISSILCLTAIWGLPATAQAPAKPPILLAKEGNFYAGGHYDKDHPAHHMVGQIYVEYQVPKMQTHPFPIVMVHGGSQTGTDFIGTPDGREGWAQYFLRRGYAVYVVDQVGRGRAPYEPDVYGPMSSQSLDYTLQKFTSQERDKLWPQARLHTQWPGKGQPGDAVFDQYFDSSVPSIADSTEQQRLSVDALAALLDRIGPSIVFVHSQSGSFGWPLAQARPGLVKAIVAAEPSGPPVHQVVVRSAQRFDVGFENAWKENEQDYYRDIPREKKFGLTDIPLNYMPAVTKDSPLQFVQQEKAEALDFARCWRQKEPARKLVGLDALPILLLGAEASFYTGYNHCNVEYLQQAGAHPVFIRLSDAGIHGNGHMMMLEKNSDQIAELIAKWMDTTLKAVEEGQPKANAAPAPEPAPLAIAEEGYFYAGGHYDKDHPDHHVIGQMYVEYRIPQERTHPFPIVLIHGGNQTGAGWFSTPDSRPGWAQYFVRNGYAVYVVDQIARGRSPFVPEVYGTMTSQALDYVMQKFTSQERTKLWPQAALHTQWPGKGEPGDPTFDQYMSSGAPGMEKREMQAQMNVDALAAVLDRIGPSIVLVHSQSGGYGWPLAQARPALVKAIVAVEPAGPPVHDVVVKSAQRFDVGWDKAVKQTDADYYRDNPGVKPYGLTTIPMTYVPKVTPQLPLRFVQQERPEKADLARCWRQAEPARKLAAVGERPVMVMEAEASFYAGYNHCNVEYLEQAGVKVDFIRLAGLGIHGNGHMMMMERNSDALAQVIVDWLQKKVTPLEKTPRAGR
jgi:pimeloyl-ACP methyl ester carboxylesterase